LVNLEHLDISSNQINSVTPLQNMVRLKKLTLSNNQIVDISSASSLTNLEELEMSNVGVCDVSCLELLPLKKLDVSHNKIEKLIISQTLGELDAGSNKIKYVIVGARNDVLTRLNLCKNFISDINNISDLVNLTKLQKLNLNGNKINGNGEMVKYGWVEIYFYRNGIVSETSKDDLGYETAPEEEAKKFKEDTKSWKYKKINHINASGHDEFYKNIFKINDPHSAQTIPVRNLNLISFEELNEKEEQLEDINEEQEKIIDGMSAKISKDELKNKVEQLIKEREELKIDYNASVEELFKSTTIKGKPVKKKITINDY
jgi:Leucine-rich repeat (LRR) protein